MIGRFAFDRSGTAGVEMALVLPFLLVLMFAGLEAGHFFWTEHKLVKAVRDGARYASRLEVGSLCDGATAVLDSGTEDDIQLLTRTGQITDTAATPTVPGWSADAVVVTVSCQAFVSDGIYNDLGGAGPIVTVASGSVPYPSIFGQLGLLTTSLNLSAKSSAAVTGI